VVQIQQMGPWLGLFHPFVIHYLFCGFLVWLAGGDRYANPYEKEAYDFADGSTLSGHPKDGQLRKCIAQIAAASPPNSVISPCECTYPWPEDNPLFKKWPMLCSTIIKATSDAENCAGGPLSPEFYFALILAAIDFIVGVFGWIFNNIADFFEGVSDFFTGGGRGGISLMFSQDGGMTWPLIHKFTIDSSSEPPALASDGSKFYISWTGTPDNKINVSRLPFGAKGIFEVSNHDAGPALTFANGQLYSVWQDEDNHLHLKSAASPLGLNTSATLNLGETLAGDATPTIAYGNGRFCLAWIGESNHISIKSSVDGINWPTPAIYMGETSPDDGTPALAFGNGRFYLAWTGDNDANNLFIKSFTLDPNGNPVHLDRTVFPQRSSDDAGPALAFASGGGLNRLFLAWTDDNQQVHVMFSDTPDVSLSSWSNSQVLGHSSDNAGPAVSFGASFGPTPMTSPEAIVCVAWIDK